MENLIQKEGDRMKLHEEVKHSVTIVKSCYFMKSTITVSNKHSKRNKNPLYVMIRLILYSCPIEGGHHEQPI